MIQGIEKEAVSSRWFPQTQTPAPLPSPRPTCPRCCRPLPASAQSLRLLRPAARSERSRGTFGTIGQHSASSLLCSPGRRKLGSQQPLGPYKGLLAMAGGAVLFAWGPYNDYGILRCTDTSGNENHRRSCWPAEQVWWAGAPSARGGALAGAAPLDGVSAPPPVVNSHCRSPLLMSPSMMQNDSASASQLARGVLRKEIKS